MRKKILVPPLPTQKNSVPPRERTPHYINNETIQIIIPVLYDEKFWSLPYINNEIKVPILDKNTSPPL